MGFFYQIYIVKILLKETNKETQFFGLIDMRENVSHIFILETIISYPDTNHEPTQVFVENLLLSQA